MTSGFMVAQGALIQYGKWLYGDTKYFNVTSGETGYFNMTSGFMVTQDV